MSDLLQRLLDAAMTDPETFAALFKDNANDLSLDMATQADKIYEQAVSAGDAQFAAAAMQVAAMIYLNFGKKYESLDSLIVSLELFFVQTATEEGYSQLRDRSLDIALKSKEIEAPDLMFKANILAADCSYFAYKAVEEFENKKNWLQTALKDILIASKCATQSEQCKKGPWFLRFVNLLSMIVEDVVVTYWKYEVIVAACLNGLAKNIEQLIPVDFEYPNEYEATFQTGFTLACLSYQHGKAENANLRLKVLARRADENGDTRRWIHVMSAYYSGARARDTKSIDVSNLVILRRSIIERYEQWRLSFASRAGRLWAAQEFDQDLGEFLRDEFRENLGTSVSNSELFETIEKSRARLLLDQMSQEICDFPTSELAAQASSMERQIFFFNPENPQDVGMFEMKLISQLSIQSESIRKKRWDLVVPLERFYKSHSAGFLTGGCTCHFSQVQTALEDGETLIEYAIPFHLLHPAMELWIMAIKSTKCRVIKVSLDDLPDQDIIGRFTIGERQPFDVSPLGQLIWKLRTNIRKAKADDETAIDISKYLWRKLIEPIFDEFGRPEKSERWIIVPDGVLHYVPFQALAEPNGTFLINHVGLTLCPSASVWNLMQKRHAQPVKSFLGFANPKITYRDSRGKILKPLPKAEDELKGIRRSLETLEFTERLRENATEEKFRNLVKGKSIVHLSTHGDFPEQDAIDFHRVLLASTSMHDGRVNAEELRRMNLDSARLVTLSICNGGLYRFGPGDEPYGLVPALLAGGAENVVSTLWPIEDDIGRRFITDFYKNLLPCGPAEALRQACIQFIQEEARIRHWAAFVNVGVGRPLS